MIGLSEVLELGVLKGSHRSAISHLEAGNSAAALRELRAAIERVAEIAARRELRELARRTQPLNLPRTATGD